MAQMKEQIKALKIELSDEEIANLSDEEYLGSLCVTFYNCM